MLDPPYHHPFVTAVDSDETSLLNASPHQAPPLVLLDHGAAREQEDTLADSPKLLDVWGVYESTRDHDHAARFVLAK